VRNGDISLAEFIRQSGPLQGLFVGVIGRAVHPPKPFGVTPRRILWRAHLRGSESTGLFRHRCPPGFYASSTAMLQAGEIQPIASARTASPTKRFITVRWISMPADSHLPANPSRPRPGVFRLRFRRPQVGPAKTFRGSRRSDPPQPFLTRRLAPGGLAGLRRSMVRVRFARWPHQCAIQSLRQPPKPPVAGEPLPTLTPGLLTTVRLDSIAIGSFSPRARWTVGCRCQGLRRGRCCQAFSPLFLRASAASFSPCGGPSPKPQRSLLGF